MENVSHFDHCKRLPVTNIGIVTETDPIGRIANVHTHGEHPACEIHSLLLETHCQEIVIQESNVSSRFLYGYALL